MKPTRAELRALAKRDPLLGAWMQRLDAFPGFPMRGHPRQATHYDSLSSAIVYQQISTKAATTIWTRACALTPGKRFPRAKELLRLSDEALRSAGLSHNKIAALRDLARRIESGELALAKVARWADERVVDHLVQVRGIGVWTAQMFLLFRLGRLDVLAPGDLGVQEGLSILDELDERPTPIALEQRAETWRPLRSVGCWMMWRLVDRARAEAARAPAPKRARRGARR